jgi:hypothetical protein
MSEEPTTTKDMYRLLVERAQLQEARGEKTRIYKEFIEQLSDDTGDTVILFQAMMSLLQKTHPAMKINRSHVRSVVEHNWEVILGEKDLLWIDLSKPKTPRNPINSELARLTDGSAVH